MIQRVDLLLKGDDTLQETILDLRPHSGYAYEVLWNGVDKQGAEELTMTTGEIVEGIEEVEI